MRFEAYAKTTALPNIIVDGPRNASTVLALSHWARSGTPRALLADTSAEIVLNYLAAADQQVEALAVSNNHFDEDGLLGIYALLNPADARAKHDLLVDASRVGDFDVYRNRSAARIAFAIGALSHAESSPWPKALFTLPFGEQTAALYERALEILPSLLDDPESFRQYWEGQDHRLTQSEALLDAGQVIIEEQPALDLAIVRLPADAPRLHAAAIHSRTRMVRVAIVQGPRFDFYDRYETWVQLASRRPRLRVNLSALAAELNLEQEGAGTWILDSAEDIIPRLRLQGGAPRIDPDRILTRLRHHLATAPIAWNPYD